MTLTLHSRQKCVRDDIKIAFPQVGILNDYGDQFDIVFVDRNLAVPITIWCLGHEVSYTIRIAD
jgi:hypothetical protein